MGWCVILVGRCVDYFRIETSKIDKFGLVKDLGPHIGRNELGGTVSDDDEHDDDDDYDYVDYDDYDYDYDDYDVYDDYDDFDDYNYDDYDYDDY